MIPFLRVKSFVQKVRYNPNTYAVTQKKEWVLPQV